MVSRFILYFLIGNVFIPLYTDASFLGDSVGRRLLLTMACFIVTSSTELSSSQDGIFNYRRPADVSESVHSFQISDFFMENNLILDFICVSIYYISMFLLLADEGKGRSTGNCLRSFAYGTATLYTPRMRYIDMLQV